MNLNGLKNRRTRLLAAGAVVVVSFAAGLILGRRGTAGHEDRASASETATVGGVKQEQIWTCSMHPQVKQPDPGDCPICAMDLIPLDSDGDGNPGGAEITLSSGARRLARVQVRPVERIAVHREVRMVGTVDTDETRLSTISAWVAGRLDRLYVDYTGIPVKEGDHMVWMYSPDVLAAQEELLQALKAARQSSSIPGSPARASAEAMLSASRDKLRLWGLTQAQIEDIETHGRASDHIQINAPTGGIVIHKSAVEGMYVTTGTPIYQIADLSRLWVLLDAYESDLPWLRYGQDIAFTAEGYPGRTFSGKIAFIDALLTTKTRTVKIRVNVPNDDGALKPGMFVRASVRAQIGGDGRVVAPDMSGKWICPMHPEIMKDGLGECDTCGMALVKADPPEADDSGSAAEAPLVIMASAPLITGRRAVVYVQDPDDESRFSGREIVLGPRTEAHYVVEAGLEEGELVVVNGSFKIDSALQIVAKPSMMTATDAGTGLTHEGQNRPGTQGTEEPERVTAPAGFIEQLDSVWSWYLEAQTALAEDDLAKAKDAATALTNQLVTVDMTGLDSQPQAVWEQSRDTLRAAAGRLRNVKTIETGREAFEALSKASIRTAKIFGTGPDHDLHVVHCPMAFDNRGADWLQHDTTIANPYFGESMLRCGDIASSIDPAQGKADAPPPSDNELAFEDVPAAFLGHLESVLNAYLATHKALSRDKPEAARAAAATLLTSLDSVDRTGLSVEADRAWMTILGELKDGAHSVADGQDIGASRAGFATLSGSMITAVRRFAADLERPLVLVRCSMAFNDRGASWLQDHEDVENPYYGAAMFRCGEVEDVLTGPGAENKEAPDHE